MHNALCSLVREITDVILKLAVCLLNNVEISVTDLMLILMKKYRGSIFKIKHHAWTVSYTHLDVYKRQLLNWFGKS